MDGFDACISIDCFLEIIKQHYYVENSNTPNYVFASEYNPSAFITCHNCSSFDATLTDIKAIDTDSTQYLNIMNETAFLATSAAQQFLKSDCIDKFLCYFYNQDVVLSHRVSYGFANEIYLNRIRFQAELYSLIGSWSLLMRSIMATILERQ